MTKDNSHGVDETLVSVIVITYNRAGTLGRAIASVAAQTHRAIDLIVVDDGSSDGTRNVLESVHDPRMRVITHDRNRGITQARNTGLDAIRGEWFTFVDSDDEIVPEAIQELLAVPRLIDGEITHVECNGKDASSGQFTGEGLDRDQYLDEETIVSKMKHDHWGLQKSTLLQGDRFNENLPGFEEVLWARIRRRAKSYYVHKALKLVYRGGEDRASSKKFSITELGRIHRHLLEEPIWLECIEKYRVGEFARFTFWGMADTLAVGDRTSAKSYLALLRRSTSGGTLLRLAQATLAGGPPVATMVLLLSRLLKATRSRFSS